MGRGPWLLGLALVLGLPGANAYEAELTDAPGDLPIVTGQDYEDPYPSGETIQVEVVVGCDEIHLADIAAGRDVPFQMRRQVDHQVGFGFAAGMPEGRFGIDPSPCLTDPGGTVRKTVTAYMAGSELAYAFVPYNVTIGVYPDETGLVSPSAGLEPPPTIHFAVQVDYIAGVWPTLASVHVHNGTVSMDVLLQTNANADTVFEFTIVEGPGSLDMPPFRLDATKGHNAGIATWRFPVPANATEESVYNWTLDFGGYAVNDPTQQVDAHRVELGIQPYKDGVPETSEVMGSDATLDGGQDSEKVTPAPIGVLSFLAVALARWSRR